MSDTLTVITAIALGVVVTFGVLNAQLRGYSKGLASSNLQQQIATQDEIILTQKKIIDSQRRENDTHKQIIAIQKQSIAVLEKR